MDTTTITNTANGTIITITKVHVAHTRYGLIILGVVGMTCIMSGLWLMFRKPKR